MQANTRVVTAHVSTNMAEKIDILAEQLDRSRGWIVKQALSAWIEKQEEYSRLTLEALSDVDAGNTISHELVEKWAESLNTENELPLPTDED